MPRTTPTTKKQSLRPPRKQAPGTRGGGSTAPPTRHHGALTGRHARPGDRRAARVWRGRRARCVFLAPLPLLHAPSLSFLSSSSLPAPALAARTSADGLACSWSSSCARRVCGEVGRREGGRGGPGQGGWRAGTTPLGSRKPSSPTTRQTHNPTGDDQLPSMAAVSKAGGAGHALQFRDHIVLKKDFKVGTRPRRRGGAFPSSPPPTRARSPHLALSLPSLILPSLTPKNKHQPSSSIPPPTRLCFRTSPPSPSRSRRGSAPRTFATRAPC